MCTSAAEGTEPSSRQRHHCASTTILGFWQYRTPSATFRASHRPNGYQIHSRGPSQYFRDPAAVPTCKTLARRAAISFGPRIKPRRPPLSETCWCTIVADQEGRNGDQKPRLSDSTLEKVHEELEGIDFDDERPWNGDNDHTKAYLFEVRRIAVGRRPFRTSEEHFGIGPRDMMPADLVYVLMGLSTPFVLSNNHDGTFQVVGEAFVNGVMDGEAVTDVAKWESVSVGLLAYPGKWLSPMQGKSIAYRRRRNSSHQLQGTTNFGSLRGLRLGSGR